MLYYIIIFMLTTNMTYLLLSTKFPQMDQIWKNEWTDFKNCILSSELTEQSWQWSSVARQMWIFA